MDLVLSLYSEDKSDSEKDLKVLKEITKGLLKLLQPRYQSNLVKMFPLKDSKKINGTVWKAKTKAEVGAQDKRRKLIGAISTEIIERKIIIFHIDGDCEWNNETKAEYKNHMKLFQEAIQEAIKYKTKEPIDLEDYFIPIIPHYSMESWAFSNTEELKKHVANNEMQKVKSWHADIGQLDEILKIKEQLKIKDSKNYELVSNKSTFPFKQQMAINKSYKATLNRMENSTALVDKLKKISKAD